MQTGNANISFTSRNQQTASQAINQNVSSNLAQRLSSSPTSQLQADLSELTKGEILKGEIINLRGSDIQILLSDGQILKASFESTLPLNIGDHASFLVEESMKDSLHLRLLPTEHNSTTDATIDKALEEAFLPKNDKNITIVSELLKNGLSIDKKSIMNMLRQSASFRNVSIETLAVMNKYHIPVTEENTTQLEAYRNYEFRLMEQTKQLTESITSVLQKLPEGSPLIEKFLALFPDGMTDSMADPNLTDGGTAIPDAAVSDHNTLADTNSKSTPLTNTDSNDFNPIFEDPNAKTNPLNSDPAASVRNYSQDVLLPDESQIPTSDLSNKQLNVKDPNSFPNPISQTASAVPTQETLLETILKNEFTLPIHKLTQPNSISKFYEKLERDLDKIHSFFSEHSELTGKEEKETILSQTNNVKDNIDFMKTLNQLFGYIQLPMKLPDKDVHSELFVYTNKKKLKEGNQQVSVLLHLDMTHLGPIDFHLSLMNNHVTAKIGMENAQSMILVEQHLPELQSVLEAKGYSMTYQMEKLEKDTKVIRDAFENNSNDLLMRRYSFDLRA